MSEAQDGKYVFVTGASGFVGGHVVRELVVNGHTAICLVRDEQKLLAKMRDLEPEAIVPVRGSVFDERVVAQCLEHADSVIHLIGIIMEQPGAQQTFSRVHVDATQAVVAAAEKAEVKRYVHMSALGARPGPTDVSKYHQTKWSAEQKVQNSSLDWTIFRPSIIHGPDGEFMEMMKFFATPSLRQPVMPYFGAGENRLQPIDVRDVARCFVRALAVPETIKQSYDLGGPEAFTWKQLYDVCARVINGKPRMMVSVPVPVAKIMATCVMPFAPSAFVPYKFNVGQVMMSQEDSVCDIEPIERTFDLKLRSFRTELSRYVDQIR